MDNHGWYDTLNDRHIRRHHRVCPGDFIITGFKGQYYVMKPDIFKNNYEAV
jgi:hypothetical protein